MIHEHYTSYLILNEIRSDLNEKTRARRFQDRSFKSFSDFGVVLWKQKKFDQARQTEVHIASIADPSEYPKTTMTRKLMCTLIENTDLKFDDAARTRRQGIAIA